MTMRYPIALSLCLAGLWLVLSGVYKPLILALGAASIALVLWITRRMEVVGAEHDPVQFSWRLPVYWGWLIWQIARANIDVAGRVLRPAAIRPRVVRAPVPALSVIGRVTYANSITLTPGTVTLDAEDHRFAVHALHGDAAEELCGGDMAEWVRWLDAPGERRGTPS